jgi:hypothetical protein
MCALLAASYPLPPQSRDPFLEACARFKNSLFSRQQGAVTFRVARGQWLRGYRHYRTCPALRGQPTRDVIGLIKGPPPGASIHEISNLPELGDGVLNAIGGG